MFRRPRIRGKQADNLDATHKRDFEREFPEAWPLLLRRKHLDHDLSLGVGHISGARDVIRADQDGQKIGASGFAQHFGNALPQFRRGGAMRSAQQLLVEIERLVLFPLLRQKQKQGALPGIARQVFQGKCGFAGERRVGFDDDAAQRFFRIVALKMEQHLTSSGGNLRIAVGAGWNQAFNNHGFFLAQ